VVERDVVLAKVGTIDPEIVRSIVDEHL